MRFDWTASDESIFWTSSAKEHTANRRFPRVFWTALRRLC
jgi:hypothetical protein